MKRRFALTAALVVAGLTIGSASAQHGHGQHGASGHLSAQDCATQFEQVVGEGRGFGLAFAADRNGYPGPMHVLELKDRLKLTADQQTRAQELYAAVRADVAKSTRLLDAERRLERLFADRTATEQNVQAAVAEIERARSEVRLVHLLAHLKMRDVLSEEQRKIYQEARWASR